MKIYLIYDRYEHDEWFSVYHVCKTKSEVKKVYKQDLIDFISYGPDDCHSFQCMIVEDISKEEYELLKKSENGNLTDSEEDQFNELMVRINDNCIWCQYPDTNCLFCTDGCSDNVDLVDYWIEYKGLDENDRDQIEEDIYNDENLYHKVLKKYINHTFQF